MNLNFLVKNFHDMFLFVYQAGSISLLKLLIFPMVYFFIVKYHKKISMKYFTTLITYNALRHKMFAKIMLYSVVLLKLVSSNATVILQGTYQRLSGMRFLSIVSYSTESKILECDMGFPLLFKPTVLHMHEMKHEDNNEQCFNKT